MYYILFFFSLSLSCTWILYNQLRGKEKEVWHTIHSFNNSMCSRWEYCLQHVISLFVKGTIMLPTTSPADTYRWCYFINSPSHPLPPCPVMMWMAMLVHTVTMLVSSVGRCSALVLTAACLRWRMPRSQLTAIGEQKRHILTHISPPLSVCDLHVYCVFMNLLK